MSRSSCFIAVLVALACGNSASATLVVDLATADTFTQSPAVTSIELDAVPKTGSPTSLATSTNVSNVTIDLGDQSTDIVASLQLTGRDSSGDAAVFGATPFAQFGALTGNVPLFVQRKNQFATLPGTLPDSRSAPLLAISNTDVYIAGGAIDGSSSIPPLVIYSLFNLALGNTAAAPQSAASFALIQFTQQTVAGDYAAGLWVDDAGATLLGLNQIGVYDLSPDAGTGAVTIPWADLAGGRTVMGDDGTAYIIGGSRTSSPSTAVVGFLAAPDTNGDPTSDVGKTSVRQGAAVGWAPSHGVFVYGGTSDNQSYGVEIVSVGQNSALATASIEYENPATITALAAVSFGNDTMLLTGDGGQPQLANLLCVKSCALQTWGMPTGVALTTPSLFAIGSQDAPAFLLVGDDPTGATVVWRLDANSATPVMLQSARKGARAIQSQTGAVLIVGGGVPTIESYVP